MGQTFMHIDPDRIREVIGKGGSVIQKIVADTGAKVDINDDGSIFIAAADASACDAAKKCIDDIVFVPEVGKLYYGRVVRMMTFGVFIEIAPGKDGLCHISKLSDHRIEKVEDACKVGDMEIGSRLLVIPEWEKDKTDCKGRVPLILDPGLAFGTGSHATTQLCLQALEQVVKPGNTVLDLGCGSGILSIAALKLDAASAHETSCPNRPVPPPEKL